MGSGGFGSLYMVNFAEIARLIVNGMEIDQQFYPTGLSGLTNGFARTLGNNIQFGCKVSAVSRHSSKAPVSITYLQHGGGGLPCTQNFDAAIVATTTRAMQLDIGITDPAFNMPILNSRQSTAIRELHMMNSSKLFVLTKTKFWQQKGLPANIQTDGLCRGLYCLDYPSREGYGVVLISYTWGDDSTKCIALKNPAERLEVLLQSLAACASDFVNAMRPQIMPQYTRLIDWQDEAQFYGAFKLNYPGQDSRNQSLYYQFLDSESGIFLAGDGVAWCGGWIEGALQTGINAAAGVVNHLVGSTGLYDGNPLSQDHLLYDYGP